MTRFPPLMGRWGTYLRTHPLLAAVLIFAVGAAVLIWQREIVAALEFWRDALDAGADRFHSIGVSRSGQVAPETQ